MEVSRETIAVGALRIAQIPNLTRGEVGAEHRADSLEGVIPACPLER
jgi:hypothetical protein